MQLAPTATDTDLRRSLDILGAGLQVVLCGARYDTAALIAMRDGYIAAVEALHQDRRRLMKQQEVAAVEAGVRAAIAAIGSR